MSDKYGDYAQYAGSVSSSYDPYAQTAATMAQMNANAAMMSQMERFYTTPNAQAAMMMSMQAGYMMDPSMAYLGTNTGYGSMGYPSAAGGSSSYKPVPPQSGYNSKGFPLRMGCPPCSYFAKTGDCNFGTNCKWDHPEEFCKLSSSMATDKAEAVGRNSLGMPLRPDTQPCTFFTKTGTCKFGAACKWDHPESYTALASTPEGQAALMALATAQPAAPAYAYNSAGYPLRDGASHCLYYVKNGNCKYGVQCKWDHPEDLASAAAGLSGKGSGYGLESEYGKMASRSGMRPSPY